MQEDYKSKIINLFETGRISKEDAEKLIEYHKEKSFLYKAKKDILQKFKYLITLELPNDKNQK
ncbi:MAG: hypothetical protein FWF57_04420 [Defluviitaleaceae bacterium]|nr:hypothetical protein [Defluviitaleaceae bacterium]